MLCNNCGSQIDENTNRCSACGRTANEDRPDVSVASTYKGPMGNPTPVLIWGIIGLAFSCSFYLSVLGIIFSIVGLKKAQSYFDFCGTGSNQANIGRKLSKAGIIVGIILTILFVIYIVFISKLLNSGLHY